MYLHLKLSFEKKKMQVPGDHPKLRSQTTGLISSYTSTNILRLEHPERGHNDYPDSLALACLCTFKSDKDRLIDLE